MLRIHREAEPYSFFMTSPHSIRKDTSPGTNKNHSNDWNWFHTLSEQKPPVKPESRETNTLHRFSCFLPHGRIREPVDRSRCHRRFSVLDLPRLERLTIPHRTQPSPLKRQRAS